MKKLNLINKKNYLNLNELNFIKAAKNYNTLENQELKPFYTERLVRDLMWWSNLLAGFANVIQRENEKYTSLESTKNLVFPY